VNGWLGGAQIGYDVHGAGPLVAGVEARFSWADLTGSHASIPDPVDIFSTRMNWIASVSGRIGYAFDQILVYGKFGAAFSDVDYTKVDLGVVEGLGSETRAGWLLGAGFEYRFARNWSAALEYNYIDFGTRQVGLLDPAVGPPPEPHDVRQYLHLVMIGVNYRFAVDPPATPIIAKN
jgi:outer membrane immunogenic protein